MIKDSRLLNKTLRFTNNRILRLEKLKLHVIVPAILHAPIGAARLLADLLFDQLAVIALIDHTQRIDPVVDERATSPAAIRNSAACAWTDRGYVGLAWLVRDLADVVYFEFVVEFSG